MTRYLLSLGLALVPVASAESWPQFRGAIAVASVEGNFIPLEWSVTRYVKWKTDVLDEHKNS